MTDIGVGDWVKCVDAGADSTKNPWAPDEAPVFGAVYQVTDVWATPTPCGASLECVGLRRVSGKYLNYRAGYGVFRFRKLNKITDQFRSKLLEPVDLGVDETTETK